MTRTKLALFLIYLPACGLEEIEAILAKYDTFGSTGSTESTGSTGDADTSSSSGASGTTWSETTGVADASSTGEGEAGLDASSDASSDTGDSSSSTGASQPICGDGVIDPGESCDDMNDNPDDGCKLCTKDRRVFASSLRYQGFTLEGLYGADQRCRMLAALAMLPNFGTYRAWLSDSKTAAADRITHSKGRYILVNGLVVAADWDALISGTLENAIDVSESSETILGGVWTGTLPNGQPAYGSSFCEDWDGEDAFQQGGRGVCKQTDALWSFYEQGYCGSEMALYCFEN